MKLSIIIPVLNEAARLPALFDRLRPLHRRGVEILVADGGSDDGSTVLADVYGFRVIRSARGRAVQMNAAAARAGGDVLLFLHADTLLPDNAPLLIETALRPPARCWGRFDVRISGAPWMLPVVAFFINLRSRLTGIATGDQAVFVRRAVFEAVGGFPVQPLMEDIALTSRLRGLSRPACLRPPAVTSGRRWERYGVWRTILLMWRLRWAYWRGADPARLAQEYER